jgi:hypothetical protein
MLLQEETLTADADNTRGHAVFAEIVKWLIGDVQLDTYRCVRQTSSISPAMRIFNTRQQLLPATIG